MTEPLLPALLPTGSLADVQLSKLFSVIGFLAIPLGGLFLLVCYQLWLLLVNVVECLTIAKYELIPTLHHCKQIASQVDEITTAVNDGIQTTKGSVANVVQGAKPFVATGEQLAETAVNKLVSAAYWVKSFFK
jgi:hypothetical protein